MRECDKCKIEVIGQATYCPLCQSELKNKEQETEDSFPVIPPQVDPYYLVVRVLSFVCLVIGSIALLINIILPIEGWWSILVIGTAACVWTSVITAISKYKNILKYLCYQSIIILLFAFYMDYFIGWHGWSITYVLPILFTLAMVVMYVLSKVLHLATGDYMIYLLVDALFGIIPIIFIGSDVLSTDIPSVICVIVSIVSVSALIVFEGKSMYSELKRRLHV